MPAKLTLEERILMDREEVWMRAFCAYVASFNARTDSSIRAADECLAAFDKRFPAMTHETQWCGKPISELDGKPIGYSVSCKGTSHG